MSALAVNPLYAALLMKTPPRVVRTEQQNEAYLVALKELDQRHETLTAEESEMADLLTLLIEDFERRQYALPKTSTGLLLEFLMDQRGSTDEELSTVLGGSVAAAEILHGSRELTTDEIRRLSEWSGVSPELFF